jgi:hypothetical protein
MSFPHKRRFGNTPPSKAEKREALRSLLSHRCCFNKPPADTDFASYARCYGVTEPEAREMWNALEAQRRLREARG